MNTPIDDFVRSYAKKPAARLHMPGHKGKGEIEKYDITEIGGADSLFEASGIIKESEMNAGELFGAYTLYSTEGSSLSIRAMLYLAYMNARERGYSPLILAGRNAHKTFLSAVGLLGLDVLWMLPESADSYLSCTLTAGDVENYIASAPSHPAAVYITSPDYLGNEADVAGISAVCKMHGVPLLVDNAHGAYLRFLSPSRHPIDLGADMCADSAHKTLPVLTGGAYLHISKNAPSTFHRSAKLAMALFASTSPSYLILASLDRANAYLYSGYRDKLCEFISRLDGLKADIASLGFDIRGSEPLKLTLCPKSYGYTGYELSDILSAHGIVCEFADPDNLVLMLTPEADEWTDALLTVLRSVERKAPLTDMPPRMTMPERVMTVREAMLSPAVRVPVKYSIGRVLAAPTVSCPPAVPILVSGEIVDENAIALFEYYGINEVLVVDEQKNTAYISVLGTF
ncbi:MAG: amino acid decarboxylase [Clostridia bacterium]|nr:amino acid decarboxylase [Clostridia bacterium]